LHFADTHIGMENYGKIDSESGLSRRVQDYLRCIDEMIEHARGRDVDLVVFAGDAFRSRNPDPTQQRAFAQRIRTLERLVVPDLVIDDFDGVRVGLRAAGRWPLPDFTRIRIEAAQVTAP